MTQAERNAAIQQKLKNYTEANTQSKQAAKAALVREGFIRKDGRATSAFADS